MQAEAMSRLEAGHAKGKIVVTMPDGSESVREGRGTQHAEGSEPSRGPVGPPRWDSGKANRRAGGPGWRGLAGRLSQS